jgi:hypothetical protein
MSRRRIEQVRKPALGVEPESGACRCRDRGIGEADGFGERARNAVVLDRELRAQSTRQDRYLRWIKLAVTLIGSNSLLGGTRICAKSRF